MSNHTSTNSCDVYQEIVEIGRIIGSARLLVAVRHEVSKVMREGFIVTDGNHGDFGYPVVVKCGKEQESVARRIRSFIPYVDVDRIANGMLGVRESRRRKS